ncbi:hypothetical protein DAC20_56 [Bacteroides phage DAC20]|nr:hypothetical protein DAC19_57 [Bacteroides phage DAC19]QIG63809.1 hypothetical protein DAC20_56 [Bacteroides phage DAC20]
MPICVIFVDDSKIKVLGNVDTTSITASDYYLKINKELDSLSQSITYTVGSIDNYCDCLEKLKDDNLYRDGKRCSWKDKVPSYIKLKPYKQNIVGYDTQHRNNLVVKNTKKYYKLKKVNRRRQKNYK